MQRLGIIALECERLASLGFFCLGRSKRVDKCLISDNLETIAVYVEKNIKRLSKALLQNNISYAVCTKKFTDKFGKLQLQGIEIIDGLPLYKQLLPEIIKKASKLSLSPKQQRVLAICGDDADFAFSLMTKLCNDFRYVKVISKNKKKVSEISEKFLDELGIPVIMSNSSSRVKCDIAVKIENQSLSVPKHTILIDGCAEHTITRKNTINWVDLSLCYNIPFDVDSLSIAQATQQLTGKKAHFKISAFRCGKNKTIFDMGKRIDNT
ncbi:MAG: hypothetical protein M0R40_01185 [Firmicutes bacterium]|nr:hypothetical protein [Bacillota bacterium]